MGNHYFISMYFKKLLFLISSVLTVTTLKAQNTQNVQYSFINLGLVPGLSTAGPDPGNYYHNISLNLFTGYSRGTYWFEISGISSENIDRTYGFQFSGLANLTGVNLFQGVKPKDIQKEIYNGNYATLNGLQFSSLINYIRGGGSGGQMTAGINVVQEMMTGVQISGLSNYSSIEMTGAQLSLISNISSGSTLGVQAGGLLNYTKNELAGFQLGAINLADNMQGKNSLSDDHSTGFQIGIFNRAKVMNGLQAGVINVAGNCRGTQIGLVNFYSASYKAGKRYGTAIGLLNFGLNASFRYYYDETFPFNIALGTGNSKNSAILERMKTKYVMNQFLYRKSSIGKSDYHAFGWLFEEQLYHHTPDPKDPYEEFYFYSGGIGLSNVFYKSEDPGLNLLAELNITGGSRISTKIPGIYIIGFIDLNYYYNNNGKSLAPEKFSRSFNEEGATRIREMWPGYGIGIQIK